jgi:hypothetical protein
MVRFSFESGAIRGSARDTTLAEIRLTYGAKPLFRGVKAIPDRLFRRVDMPSTRQIRNHLPIYRS